MLFLKNEEGKKIYLEDIQRLQAKYNIIFPEELKNYYLENNGKKIYLCVFGEEKQYEISKILPLCDKNSVESIKDSELIDGFIASDMIPFAMDRGGDYYYWNSIDKGIYLIRGEDIENPRYICSSFSELCTILDNSEIRK